MCIYHIYYYIHTHIYTYQHIHIQKEKESFNLRMGSWAKFEGGAGGRKGKGHDILML